jgi:hypothetical protein
MLVMVVFTKLVLLVLDMVDTPVDTVDMVDTVLDTPELTLPQLMLPMP